MKFKQPNETTINSKIFILLVVLALFNFFMSIPNIYNGLKPIEEDSNIRYVYKLTKDVDYKVYMFENSFFEEEYLGMDKQYTAKLVDTIDIEFMNTLSTSQMSDDEYDYSVTATINGKYKNDPNDLETSLWSKEYVLVDKTTNRLNNVLHDESVVPVTIDYSYYRQLVAEFQKELRLDIDAVLDIDFNIDYVFYIEGEKATKSGSIRVQIPLSDPTFNIDINNPIENEEIVYYSDIKKYNYSKIYGGIALLVSSMVCIIMLIIILVINHKKTEYTYMLNKILKDYGDIIAETSNAPSLEKQEVLEIINFIDLVDIEEELKMPIIYYEKRKNKEAWFLITNNKQTYRFILKETKKKK